jgi:hypothetical protein
MTPEAHECDLLEQPAKVFMEDDDQHHDQHRKEALEESGGELKVELTGKEEDHPESREPEKSVPCPRASDPLDQKPEQCRDHNDV